MAIFYKINSKGAFADFERAMLNCGCGWLSAVVDKTTGECILPIRGINVFKDEYFIKIPIFVKQKDKTLEFVNKAKKSITWDPDLEEVDVDIKIRSDTFYTVKDGMSIANMSFGKCGDMRGIFWSTSILNRNRLIIYFLSKERAEQFVREKVPDRDKTPDLICPVVKLKAKDLYFIGDDMAISKKTSYFERIKAFREKEVT